MTLVSEIITDAYRQSNLIMIGSTPTDAQNTEALRYLNRFVKSVFGLEAGDRLTSFAIGSLNISRPTGYPWWDDAPDGDWFVPEDTRLMLNLEEPLAVFLTPDPDDGARFAVLDTARNLSTNSLTISGNGRRISGETTITLTEDAYAGEWFYRADTGNWELYSPLSLDDPFPFPLEFDDFFITSLAMRVNPAYGAALDQQAANTYQRSKRQLQARYSINKPEGAELGLLRMPKVSAQRELFQDYYSLYDSTSSFNRGWPY